MDNHPFANYLRILGKGPKSRRSLNQEEATEALQMILSNEVTDKQLGAFLLLMRANGESQDELIGFVKGLRRYLKLENKPSKIDLDWAAYAGKWRYPPYFLLSIKLLIEQGYKIILHGDSGQFNNRQYAQDFLQLLGFTQARSIKEASQLLEEGKATYLPLQNFAPQLREILHLKSELGVRTVFNTAVKLLNPLNARFAIQGIYHKGVENLHHASASINGIEKNLVFKGEGGEPEMRPDALTHLYFSEYDKENKKKEHNALKDIKCRGIIERQIRPNTWKTQDLLGLWQGEYKDVYGKHAVIATTAVALMLLEDFSLDVALEKSTILWETRTQIPA